MTCIDYRENDPYHYVEEYFHVSKYVDGYIDVIEPTLGNHQWSHLSSMVGQPLKYHDKEELKACLS